MFMENRICSSIGLLAVVVVVVQCSSNSSGVIVHRTGFKCLERCQRQNGSRPVTQSASVFISVG